MLDLVFAYRYRGFRLKLNEKLSAAAPAVLRSATKTDPRRRRIDEGHVGRRIRHQHGVEQRLVPRLQVGEHEIPQQIVVEIGDLGMAPGDLQIDARHGGWQQTFKPQARRSAMVMMASGAIYLHEDTAPEILIRNR